MKVLNVNWLSLGGDRQMNVHTSRRNVNCHFSLIDTRVLELHLYLFCVHEVVLLDWLFKTIAKTSIGHFCGEVIFWIGHEG